MNTNTVLDVGLGLITMFLMLSLACTVLNEYIAGVMRLRARLLSSELPNLIDDAALRATFEQHGLISTQRSAGGGQASYLSSTAVAKALLDSLDPTKPVALVADVVQAAKALPESNVKDAILVAATSAGSDIDKVRYGIAAWFDNAMDRLSGVYKRNMQWLSLAVGLALVVALNADTVNVAYALWRDGTLRSEIVTMAGRIDATGQKPLTGGKTDPASLDTNLRSVDDNLRPFPFGWTGAHALPKGTAEFLSKILGLFVTALAISLGAPFWFDLLSKFVDVRATGARPSPVQDTI